MVTSAMDSEATDSSTGVADALNGETKPDPARLAQTAIIKQVGAPFAFVMLANINYPGHMSFHILCSPMHIFNYAHFGYATLPTERCLRRDVRIVRSTGSAVVCPQTYSDIFGRRKKGCCVASQCVRPKMISMCVFRVYLTSIVHVMI